MGVFRRLRFGKYNWSLLLVLWVLGLANSPAVAETPLPSGFEGSPNGNPEAIRLSDELSEFRFDPATGNFVFRSRIAPETEIRSNPAVSDLPGPINEFNANRLRSQLVVETYNKNDQEVVMDSYSYCVDQGGLSVTRSGDRLSVEYRFTNYKRGETDIPIVVSQDRFENGFLPNVDEEDRELLLNRFKFDQEHGVYRRYRIPAFEVEDFIRILDLVGYTVEDLEEDRREYAELIDLYDPYQRLYDLGLEMIQTQDEDRISFTIVVEYTLDQGDLIVTVPGEQIEFDNRHPIHKIRLLEFLGAIPPGEPGFILVPDGSGALIETDQVRETTAPYQAPVYGPDILTERNERIRRTLPVYLPVFGVRHGQAGFFAIIEDGDALATLNAQAAGRTSPLNQINVTFRVMEKGQAVIGQETQKSGKLVFAPQPHNGDMKLRIHPLPSSEADYSGMARYYRRYLQDFRSSVESQAPYRHPLTLEFLGGVKRNRSVLGIQFPYLEVLTGFQHIVDGLDLILSSGANHPTVQLRGWFGYGLDDDNTGRFRPASALGGENGWQQLNRYAQAQGVEVRLVSPPALFRPTFFRSFRNTEAARLPDQQPVRTFYYDPVTMQIDQDSEPWIVRTSRASTERLTEFVETADTLGASAHVSGTRHLIQSDFSEGSHVDREQAKDHIQSALNQLAPIHVTEPYGFLLPFAALVTDVPYTSSRFEVFTRDVPFLALVLNGLVPFTGPPVNLTSSSRETVLRSFEHGSGLRFVLTEASTDALQGTVHSSMFSTAFDDWSAQIVQLQRNATDVYDQIVDPVIEEHRMVQAEVALVTYASGERLAINFGRHGTTVQDVHIPAANYQLFSRKQREEQQ